jgi:hypothetical protein
MSTAEATLQVLQNTLAVDVSRQPEPSGYKGSARLDVHRGSLESPPKPVPVALMTRITTLMRLLGRSN